ncbi:HET-domain-containing protein [Hyaloscypha variabilis F]|uniref:HET-domain-containing protein n=1 Tax=Hyaloscypha variabilis (strain UAMH 11265 / GT02V1 / F) TaxID=1149755 RepID=A0A2J6RJV6_HYAVF|nr:HET-domain-containing protein [Hyaloscypha variabilis F]
MITTTGEIPDVESGKEDSGNLFDPTMHPDHQFAPSGVLDLFAYPDDPAAWHGGVRGRQLPKTAGDSDEDFELAKQWLNDCLCGHDDCRKPNPRETRLPTRVLDIGPGDGSEEPYLLETNGMHGLYIALSHCWGGQVPLTTTSCTVLERKKSTPMSLLPQTFRDAVFISRKLGVRYLWIDSLCIIQDSKTDWEKESAVMGDVYGRSHLTIAARGAANAEIGCFIPRKEEPPACCLEYKNADGSIRGQMFVRNPAFEIERIDRSPLDERGWVLQERILSPRILYYGSQQLYWECTSATIRQDGKDRDVHNDGLRPGGFKEDWDPARVTKPKFATPEDEQLSEMSGVSVEALERTRHWYLIADHYTRRKLTFDSDRLPAIAGVAKEFHRKTSYAYVAGLWKEDLITGLLWYRSSAYSAHDAPTSSELPTWSWARFSGTISFWSYTGTALLYVLDTDCELLDISYDSTANLYNYGEISNARIQIKGRYRRIGYLSVNTHLGPDGRIAFADINPQVLTII